MANNLFSQQDIQDIYHYPHLIGHMIGKTKLTDLHSAWILYIWDTNIDRSLMGHRGSYKTTAITEVGTIWWMLFHSNDRIGLMRKTFSETWAIGEAIVKYMASDCIRELFRAVHGKYPRILKKDRSSGIITYNFKKYITKEGSLNIYGVDTGITGAHLDKFLADDAVTIRDKTSQAERNRTKEMIKEIRTNIMDPDSEFAMVGTPWHRNDAWELCPKPILFPWESTGIFTNEQIEKKRQTTTTKDFAINYDLKHINSKNAIFIDPLLAQWQFTATNPIAHIDAKYQGDCTGALTIRARRQDGMVQMTGRVFEEHVDEVIDDILDLLQDYRVKTLYMEANADKGYLAKEVRKRLIGRKQRLTVLTYHESTNKHVKIVSWLKTNWGKIVWDNSTECAPYLSQILDYEEGEKPDDCADSAASIERESATSLIAEGMAAR